MTKTLGGHGLQEILKEVRRIEVQTARLVSGVMAGSYRSVFRGSGIEFDEVREYEEGDDPRSVDWNVTARVGRPFVKRFVEERELNVVFVLDLSRSMDGGFSAWSLRQAAARILACLALSAVRNNDKVSLIAFSDRVERLVPPRKGMRNALRILREALALPSGGATGLGCGLDAASKAGRRHAVVFVLSDFMASGFDRALFACARRHDVVAVRLLPPEIHEIARGERIPPSPGRLRDPETGEVALVDLSHGPTRAAFRDRIETWMRATDRVFSRAGVDVMDVEVPRTADMDALVKPVLGFFRMREERGARR